MNDRKPNKRAAKLAERCEVSISIERYGIYGDMWDWEARPTKPDWYPTVRPARIPVGVRGGAEMAIRIVAENMGTL